MDSSMCPQMDAPTLSPFNMELLMASIANNDSIIRGYHEKCDENERLHADIQSITESAKQVRQMYGNEKDQKDRLHKETVEMRAKINRLESCLAAMNNEQVNSETLHNQTVADFEAKIQMEKQKYLDLCRIVVDQGNILKSNGSSTAQLTRKCTFAREILESNGLKCEGVKSPKKKPDPNRLKSKTISTQPDQMEPNPMPASTPATKCDKSTQYQQSKATRSTCTSTFIRFTNAFTTMEEQVLKEGCDSGPPETYGIREEVESYPMPFSSNPEEIVSKMAQSTQTKRKEYCSQETLTAINNVRKPIDYVRIDSPVGVMPEKVKKEDISSAFGAMSNHCWTCLASHPDLSRDAGSQLNPSVAHLWQLMGHVLFTMINQRNGFGAANQTTHHHDSIQRMQHQLQNMIDENVKEPDDVPDQTMTGDNDNDAIDLDERSQDSIESYNSGKIVISKVRDSSEVLRESVSESMDGTADGMPFNNVDNNRTTKVTGSIIESNTSLTENVRAQSPHRITVRNVATGSESIPKPKRSNNRIISPIVSSALPKIVVSAKGNVSPEKQPLRSSNSTVNDFKVPKRKSSDVQTKANAKKRKCIKRAESEKDSLASIFGDDFEDETVNDIATDQIQRIFDFFKVPMMLSPIRDWDTASEEPQQMAIESSTTLTNNNFIAEPMVDSNKDPIDEATNNLIEKPMHDSIGISTNDMDEMPIAQPAANAINEKLASDSIERPNNAIPSTVQHSIANAMEGSDASDVDSGISPGSDAESISCSCSTTEISPEKVNEPSECNAFDEAEMDYFSPASPQPESYAETKPCLIPTETLPLSHAEHEEESNGIQHDTSESAINQIIQKYSPQFAKIVAISSATTLLNAESYLIANLRNAIERYCASKEWQSQSVAECLDKMLSLTRHIKLLATALFEVIEDTQETVSLEFTPPAPALQPSLQRCLLLYSQLAHNIPAFDEYVVVTLERRMFVFTNELSVEALTNLTHFYIAITDIEQPSNGANMRLFIYKCLYYFTYKSIPLVFAVLMAHPFILPHATAAEFLTDPLSKAIVSVLTSITYSAGTNISKAFKKTEMFLALKSRFGYFADKVFPIDGTIEFCIDCIQMNRLTNVDYALILLAKRQGYEFAVKNILQKYLIPLLHRYFANDLATNTQHDHQIITILFVISSIVKTLPTEESIDDYLNLLRVALNATDRQIIQEAAISGMCQLSRFGTTRIYQLIRTWRPNYELSRRVSAMLNTIVYKKPMHFWFNNNNNENNNNNKANDNNNTNDKKNTW